MIMVITIEKFLSKYFSSKQLKETLDDIGIAVGVTKKERIKRIIENWTTYHRDWYELLCFLDWGKLAKICDDFGITYSDYNTEDTLRNKIEDERILDFRKETMKKFEKKMAVLIDALKAQPTTRTKIFASSPDYDTEDPIFSQTLR